MSDKKYRKNWSYSRPTKQKGQASVCHNAQQEQNSNENAPLDSNGAISHQTSAKVKNCRLDIVLGE